MCSVLAAPMMKALLGLIHKWLKSQVCYDALTQNEQQRQVPGSTDDSKNSASAN